MKKILYILIISAFMMSCSTAVRVNNVDNMGSNIDEGNDLIGRNVIRVNGTSKPDEIYYIPFFKHNW